MAGDKRVLWAEIKVKSPILAEALTELASKSGKTEVAEVLVSLYSVFGGPDAVRVEIGAVVVERGRFQAQRFNLSGRVRSGYVR